MSIGDSTEVQNDLVRAFCSHLSLVKTKAGEFKCGCVHMKSRSRKAWILSCGHVLWCIAGWVTEKQMLIGVIRVQYLWKEGGQSRTGQRKKVVMQAWQILGQPAGYRWENIFFSSVPHQGRAAPYFISNPTQSPDGSCPRKGIFLGMGFPAAGGHRGRLMTALLVTSNKLGNKFFEGRSRWWFSMATTVWMCICLGGCGLLSLNLLGSSFLKWR